MTESFRVVVVGNPENRRITLFQQSTARRGLAPAVVVPWLQLARGGPEAVESALGGLREEDGDTWIRLESFGENAELDRELLVLGFAALEGAEPGATRATPDEVRALPEDRGRIFAPRQHHLGFLRVLGWVADALRLRPWLRVWPSPHSVERLFDKRVCARTFAGVGVPIPMPADAAGDPAALRRWMTSTGTERVVVKLSCGSSASCLALFRHAEGQPESLFTSMEIAGERLYNSLRPRRYTERRAIDRLLGFLLAEGSHIEAYVPKCLVGGRHVDTRMLVIGGEVAFTVVRKSAHPITNLHLGGTRGTLDELASVVSPAILEAAYQSCARVFAAHDCVHLGVDVMFTAGGDGHRVLEANAFGDLLPNLERDGLDVYEHEIEAVRATFRNRGSLRPRV